MELKDYLAALRRFWPIWVGATVLGVVLAVLFVNSRTPTYEARAQVFVASSSTGTAQFVSQRVKSYPDVAVSQAVLGPVINRLGMDETFQAARHQVSATNPVDTSQIVITATSSDPGEATDLANAVAEDFTVVVEELERTDAGPSPVALTVTDPATRPTAPVSPQPLFVMALGAVVGLLLGLALAIGRSRNSSVLYDEAGVRAAWGEDEDVDVLVSPTGHARRGALVGRPAGTLARRLELMSEDGPVRVLLLPPTTAKGAHRSVVAFAHDVERELTALGVPAATVDHDPEQPATGAGSPPRVRLELGSPTAPLRVWRQVARDFTGVVLVVPSGRLVAGELREMRAILANAGIEPHAVVLTPGRARHVRASRPVAAAAASTALPAGAKPEVPPAAGGGKTKPKTAPLVTSKPAGATGGGPGGNRTAR